MLGYGIVMVTETLGQRLRRARTDAGMSQSDFAARTGMHPTAVSHFESERREPTLANLRKMAEALGVSLDALAGTPNEESTVAGRLHAIYADVSRRGGTWALLRSEDRQAWHAIGAFVVANGFKQRKPKGPRS